MTWTFGFPKRTWRNRHLEKGDDLHQPKQIFFILVHAALICCLDLFTMLHARHHKSGIGRLLSGITSLVWGGFIKLLFRKRKQRNASTLISFLDKKIPLHRECVHVKIFFSINRLVIYFLKINKRPDKMLWQRRMSFCLFSHSHIDSVSEKHKSKSSLRLHSHAVGF